MAWDGPYSALIDASTYALLALSRHPAVVAQLVKSAPLEAEQAHGVNWPNYRKEFPIWSHPRVYEWTWDGRARKFTVTREELLTDDLKRRSALAIKKCQALWEIGYEISVARYAVWRGVSLQETVYLNKKLQAQKYKDAGYPADEVMPYSYVVQYADLAGLTMQAAADEILFKAQLDDEFLCRTETLRIGFANAVKDAREVKELDDILENFRQETYRKPAV